MSTQKEVYSTIHEVFSSKNMNLKMIRPLDINTDLQEIQVKEQVQLCTGCNQPR